MAARSILLSIFAAAYLRVSHLYAGELVGASVALSVAALVFAAAELFGKASGRRHRWVAPVAVLLAVGVSGYSALGVWVVWGPEAADRFDDEPSWSTEDPNGMSATWSAGERRYAAEMLDLVCDPSADPYFGDDDIPPEPCSDYAFTFEEFECGENECRASFQAEHNGDTSSGTVVVSGALDELTFCPNGNTAVYDPDCSSRRPTNSFVLAARKHVRAWIATRDADD